MEDGISLIFWVITVPILFHCFLIVLVCALVSVYICVGVYPRARVRVCVCSQQCCGPSI